MRDFNIIIYVPVLRVRNYLHVKSGNLYDYQLQTIGKNYFAFAFLLFI